MEVAGGGPAATPATFGSYSAAIKERLGRVVREKLGTEPYDHMRVKVLVKELTDAVLAAAREVTAGSYKIVASATIVPGHGGVCQVRAFKCKTFHRCASLVSWLHSTGPDESVHSPPLFGDPVTFPYCRDMPSPRPRRPLLSSGIRSPTASSPSRSTRQAA